MRTWKALTWVLPGIRFTRLFEITSWRLGTTEICEKGSAKEPSDSSLARSTENVLEDSLLYTAKLQEAEVNRYSTIWARAICLKSKKMKRPWLC